MYIWINKHTLGEQRDKKIKEIALSSEFELWDINLQLWENESEKWDKKVAITYFYFVAEK